LKKVCRDSNRALIVREDCRCRRDAMFDRLLVAFDGTAESRRAFKTALELAVRFQSRITIAIVRSSTADPGGAELENLVPIDPEGKSLAALLDDLKAEARTRGVMTLEPVFLRGETVSSLVEYLSRNPQDLAVVGSRGLSRGRRILLGSVSTGLATDAPCPVLVVRPTRAARSA
jgi:nucleotide-binding universal stress UspA family protein